jgi:hypothetical protein
MSKVQLQGNVSGNGTFSIVSPNSNVSHEISLPDATGTVILDSTLPPGSLDSFEILDTQTFETSGTWVKPTGADEETDSVVVILVAGGGSGGVARTQFYGYATGGGCSACIAVVPLKALDSTESVTIGAGGAARTSTTNNQSTNGQRGGTTSFGPVSLIGGGGGPANQSENSTSNSTGGDCGSLPVDFSGFGIPPIYISSAALIGQNGRGASSGSTTYTQPSFSGGGGAGHENGTQRTANYPAGPAGEFTGAGGAGAQATGSNGSAPGGGGGGAVNTNTGTVTSGAGANGWARVYVCKGTPTAAAFYIRRIK